MAPAVGAELSVPLATIGLPMGKSFVDPAEACMQEAVLSRIFEATYRRICTQVPQLHRCEFFRYKSLQHTIRLREGKIMVRISDILRDAPEPVLESVVEILLCKLLKRRVPSRSRTVYREYVLRPHVRDRLKKVRRERGRKLLTPETGAFHDLRHICEDLNRRYFGGDLRIPRLSWSNRPNKRILGHWDEAHRTIVVDRRLDARDVPEYVVAFVVYHEMLHAHYGDLILNGRRYVHHRPFREAERRFSDFDRARRFIRRRLA